MVGDDSLEVATSAPETDATLRIGSTDAASVEQAWAMWPDGLSVGATDGESVERGWANLVTAATHAMREPERREMLFDEYREERLSRRQEMCMERRQDVIGDHLSDWSWGSGDYVS